MLSCRAVEVQAEARLGSTEEAAGSIPADRLAPSAQAPAEEPDPGGRLKKSRGPPQADEVRLEPVQFARTHWEGAMGLFRHIAPTALGADRDSGHSGRQALQNLSGTRSRTPHSPFAGRLVV